MSPVRAEEINGHEVHEYAWGRDMVVYMDHQRWDASFESACRWAEKHDEPWRYASPAPSETERRG